MSYADIIKKKQKEWNCPKLMNSIYEVQGDRIPFSSPRFNWVTYGGIPRDRIIEFYGDFGSGKSSTALDVCKNASALFRKEFDDKIAELQQKMADGDKYAEDEIEELQEVGPKKVTYIDIENAFDIKWAETNGLNFDGDEPDIDVMQPPNVIGEDLLQTVRDIVSTGEVGLVVLDSIAALTPKAVLEKKIGERTVAALAGLMTTFSMLITPLLTRYHCTLILINQIRDNMDNPYVVNTPGGKAPKFFASLRMQFRKGKFVDFLGGELPNNAENPAGCIIQATITKQKTAPNDRKMGSYYLMFDSGIRPDFDYALLAMNDYSLIRKTGGWYSFVSPKTGEVLENADGKPIKVNGMANVYNYLQTNSTYYEELKEYIMNDINGKSGEITDDGEETD